VEADEEGEYEGAGRVTAREGGIESVRKEWQRKKPNVLVHVRGPRPADRELERLRHDEDREEGDREIEREGSSAAKPQYDRVEEQDVQERREVKEEREDVERGMRARVQRAEDLFLARHRGAMRRRVEKGSHPETTFRLKEMCTDNQAILR
jgi:hypothetical protein